MGKCPLDGHLIQLQSNSIDILSVVNYSIGQNKRNSVNFPPSVNSKYVSKLKGVTRRDNHFLQPNSSTQFILQPNTRDHRFISLDR